MDAEELAKAKLQLWKDLEELTKRAHAIAAACDIGNDRVRFFNLTEILRTAPRESIE